MKPLLYSIVPQKTLQSMAETFYACIHLSIQIINEHGETLVSEGGTHQFCRLFQKHLPPSDTCEKAHVDASKQAISIGEAYIFECHAELNHIVFPLISRQTFLGSILVGPFLMDRPDSILISNLTRKYDFTTDQALDLYDELSTVPIIPPSDVSHISRLLFYLFSNLIADSKKELQRNSQKLLQQSRISESIQRYKEESLRLSSYPYARERELLSRVKLGDSQGANAILNDLLGYVLFSRGTSLEAVKPRALELCSLLSRTAIEGGAPADSMLALNSQFLKNLQQTTSLDGMCHMLQEVVEAFSESMFSHDLPLKNNDIVKKAMVYIADNFNTPLTLEDVSDHVHLHPSYFSTVFKSATGLSFKEYLNKVRIEESKILLQNTDFSIIDIAVAVGFEDQSYFSKVFKKYTGTTPKQFR